MLTVLNNSGPVYQRAESDSERIPRSSPAGFFMNRFSKEEHGGLE
jgi:hypothetical protein